MAAKLTLVKKLVSAEVVNSYQLILNALFGNNLPEEYDPTKVYTKGDPIIIIKDDGSYILQVAKESDVTGEYDSTKWNTISFTDLFKEGSSLDIDFSKAIQFSDIQPESKDNVIWLQPYNTRTVSSINIK